MDVPSPTSKPVIVSACLAGMECRYDCKAKERASIVQMVKEGKAIPVCPEQMGGLSTPRPPAEKVGSKVLTKLGQDVTDSYNKGAIEALKVAKMFGAQEAYLKTKSPMCGYGAIYDGHFCGHIVDGNGIFTELLLENKIKIHPVD